MFLWDIINMIGSLLRFENIYVLCIGRYSYLTSDISHIDYLQDKYNLEIYDKTP